MANETLNFFRDLPKMTNNHVHIFAMYPLKKLIETIEEIDHDLYEKIFVYLPQLTGTRESRTQKGGEDLMNTGMITSEMETDIVLPVEIPRGTFSIIDDDGSGIHYEEKTNRADWTPLSKIGNKYLDTLTVSKHVESNTFARLDSIHVRLRVLIRNYKVYYYMWYLTLQANFRDNIFYLNVRMSPGSINQSTKFSERFYPSSKNIIDYNAFAEKMAEYSGTDKYIKPNFYKYMYRLYGRIKYESDLIVRAHNNFNEGKKISKITDEELQGLVMPKFTRSFDKQKRPQVMAQYIITFSKQPKTIELDIPSYISVIKQTIYVCILINREYGFQFFNGVDFVGNEQKSHSLEEFQPYLKQLFYFRKFGFNFIPHFGESSLAFDDLTPTATFLLDNGINRFGHAIDLTNTATLTTYLAKKKDVIYVESCPISNYVLDYYDRDKHPHQKYLLDDRVRIMICSDDNGPFNYETVTDDYVFVYENWFKNSNNKKEILLHLIKNGLGVIAYPWNAYYEALAGHLLKNYDFSPIN